MSRSLRAGLIAAALLGLLVALVGAPASAESNDRTKGKAKGKPVAAAVLPDRFPAEYLTGVDVAWAVTPKTYGGVVTVTDSTGAELGSATAAAGWVRMHLRAATLGTQRLTVRLAGDGKVQGATQTVKMVTRGPRLVLGRRGPIVRLLVQKLDSLNFHIPKLTSRYSKRVSDVVLAFQKAHGLQRSATMGRKAWQALAKAQPMEPRSNRKGTYIEVDKTRQILMLVRKREVLGTLHVSTGATGNTPEGWFRIYSKAPNSLYRFMPFLRGFGLHGYVPVPPYPASHGCVREPMWAADWTYNNSRVGTRVFIYH